MKRYFLFILMVSFISITSLIAGCNQEQAKIAVQIYLREALPIVEKHIETTETLNKAYLLLMEKLSSSTRSEANNALARYKETLEWTLSRTISELLDFKELIPPQKAKHFHNLMIENLTKEQTALDELISYYSSVLRDSSADDGTLNNANLLMSEAQQIWLQSLYELQNLIEWMGQ